MPQHDMVLDNAAGAAFRADANNALAALVANSSGATEPATKYAFQFWADTSTGLLKIRNAANNAWVTIGTMATAGLGLVAIATQGQQETGTAIDVLVTPGRQHLHPSALKFWGKCGIAGDLYASFNIASVSDRGTGQVDVVIATDFSSGHYQIAPGMIDASSTRAVNVSGVLGQAAGGFTLESIRKDSGGYEDPSVGYFFSGSGDQA